MINYILFDMDNCLYPASSGLCSEMDRRITAFVADRLSLPVGEAAALRKENVKIYGTTLKWLEECKNFTDIDEYNMVIHPADVENYLTPSKELISMLEELPCRASILTNAPKLHADRVLGFLGIAKFFEHIFHLGFSSTRGKPHKDTYLRALELTGADLDTTLFIDDVPDYLSAYRDLGGPVLLVDEAGRHASKSLPVIPEILQLPVFLKEL